MSLFFFITIWLVLANMDDILLKFEFVEIARGEEKLRINI